MEIFKELYTSPDVWAAFGGDTLAVVWRKPIDSQQFRHTVTAATHTLRNRTEKFGVFVVLGHDHLLPSPELRETSQTFLKRIENQVLCSAIVVGATGFSGAAQRAAMSAMGLFVRPPYPTKIFGNTQDAVAWYQKELTKHIPDSNFSPPHVLKELEAAHQI